MLEWQKREINGNLTFRLYNEAMVIKMMKKLNIKYLLVPLIILVLLLSSSCALPHINSAPPSNPSAPTEPGWTPPTSEQNQPLPDFISVVSKVKPSVVAINTKIVTYVFGQPLTQEGAGSGWIIDEKGYIVTNNHVVEGAQTITVTLDDGRTFPATVVGTDFLTDLAVVKIDAKNLVAASTGNSAQLMLGEWVLAIGNSLGLGVTPSEGIIRSLGASITVSAGQTLHDLIGTSAAINPGNSGGPLVDMSGEVVGITSVKISMVGVEAMGWAISINSALPIITQLIDAGHVTRPYLGVSYTDVNPYLVLQYNLAVNEGILVNEVLSGYPAEEAGLKSGDVIVEFNGEKIANTEDFIPAITACEIGQRVEIVYWRGESKFTTYATLTEGPAL
jgi:serine protease Do